MIKALTYLLFLVSFFAIVGCTATSNYDEKNIDRLAFEIEQLGPSVSAEEASRASYIAHTYSLQLAKEYNVTTSAMAHNQLVVHGLRKRGYCNHYTEDLSKRLKQEDFRTLTVHWAVSPPAPLRIIHHSVIISPRGGTIDDGILLDPWRNSGVLFYSKPQDDERYDWRTRAEVREQLLLDAEARDARFPSD
ncbi:MAG: hypothetical protein HOI86_06555 [Tateyamaria sp.]|jgi:hypothetical protein|nr:hypothetical protein [Tateyamaria sp.]MBT5301987.1 hypothetical protein [Tateyamaria sp.]MBT6267329.1 hypothetical protein [Tateyamaria sp.]MBT6344814.1 hypothetical protein [Tateyamaria sp.]MBT7446983.1 hypothetical protein [Tateyamaria sp.]